MPIDNSIYFQQQTPDFAGSLQKGLNFRQMLDKSDNDREKLSQEKKQHMVEMTARLAPGIKDQASYDSAKQQLADSGIDTSKMNPTYVPEEVNHYANMALTAKDQADNQLKREDFTQRNADRQENRDMRQQMFGIQMQDRRDSRADKKDQKISDQTDKYSKEMKNDLDADRGRAGNFGQISAKVQQADRLKTLVSSYKNGDLPPQQMEELALGMANMLSGSSGAARSQVEALVPHTWWGGKQSAQQWLMNEPTGAGQQKFVEAMTHTIDRERETANNQLNNIRASRLAAHEGLRKIAPDQYNANLRSYDLDPTRIKDGKYLPPPSEGLVLMKDPQGNIRQVKADLVEAAKKAGGQVVTEQVAEK